MGQHNSQLTIRPVCHTPAPVILPSELLKTETPCLFSTKTHLDDITIGPPLPPPIPKPIDPNSPAHHCWLAPQQWTLEPIYCPFPCWTKRCILGVTALAGTVAPLASNIFLPALPSIAHGLGTSVHQVSLAISVFMVGMALGPLLWGPLADRYGRRAAYGPGFLLCVAASVCCALAPNIQTLIAARFFQSLGGSTSMVVGAGTISDLYEPHERGTALGLFFSGQMLGPVVGTVCGGYIAQGWGWRWVFWVTALVAGLSGLCLTVLLPETHRPTVARRYGIDLKGLTVEQPRRLAAMLNIFPLLRFPYVALPIICSACFFGTLYGIKTIIPVVLTSAYGLSSAQTGLCFISIGVGNIVGSLLGGYIADWTMNHCQPTGASDIFPNKPLIEPCSGSSAPVERRLQLLLVTTVLFPVALTAYGWCLDRHSSIPLLMALQFILSVAMHATFSGLSAYLVDLFSDRSASITSLANFFRCLYGALWTGVIELVGRSLGTGWSLTLLSGICLLSSGLIYTLYWKGSQWRSKQPPQ
ncbi:major facilitator superfamily domain-containing protein [Dimargaris cristalligena]|uniref:Major facilitator superfamily domain-containing protein n=1 Tax=Dimargaris cristalligena TaxID=215637 RepID=A0A4Q0A084_9FUNG|nr:major facilitator superfamily domain-containing protein [Dimargaris cristalligena]|eukprot:RKP39397.1 major facilitator superfamily domain-containing protein [Dimargaris cristalligena]